jgi:hypothetical protein
VTPLVSATEPMVFYHSMGTNPFVFPSGTSNHDTQPIPWDSNHFSLGMPNMTSHLSSCFFLSYVNPSFGSGGMMPPYSSFLFGGGHIPQPTPMVGGWNPPSSGPISSFTFLGSSSQMGGPYTYYISSIYHFSAMLVPMNAFLMVKLLLSSSVSFEGSQFYNMGNPLHEVPSSGGNITAHLSNPCHIAFSSQAASSMMMPLQPFMNHFGGGYHPTGQGHGVYQNPSWTTISQNQSFSEPWSQMSQPTVAIHDGNTSPVTTSHTGIISPTYASHVGDRSTTSAIHVEDQKPTAIIHVGGTTLFTASHTAHTSPTSASHIGDLSTISASHVEDMPLASASHARNMSPATTSHAGGIHTIEKPKHIGHKPKFLCRICKGDHLTRFFPATAVV